MHSGIVRRTAQGLPRGKPALNHHPHFPVGGESLPLAVRADHYSHAIITQLFSSLSHIDMVVMVVGRFRPTHATRFYKLRG